VNQQLRRRTFSVLLAIALSTCGGSKGPSTPTTPSNTAPTVTSVTVTAPESSAKPGDSSQFTATAAMSNATTQTITNQASWQSSNGAIATVSSTGFVTAVAPGEADIRASYQNVTGSAHITVRAPATFTVCGTVRESTTNAVIGGARVEILNGLNAGKSADTDNAGAYCVAAVQAGTFTMRASRNSYNSAEQSVTASGAVTVNFLLQPTSSPNPNPTPSPTPNPNPQNGICDAAAYPSSASCGKPSAVCNDNSLSCSANRSGTCSTHSGVKCWLCPGTLCSGLTDSRQTLDYTPVPLAIRPEGR
jgi:hypothetical protein